MANDYSLNGKTLEKQYKHQLSDFDEWDQRDHAEAWLLFPENIGKHMSIDETALSRGELYTIITNKAAKGGKGAIFAMIRGTKADDIVKIINTIPRRVRHICKEITMDFANNMADIAHRCFPWAKRVRDRFHLHQLVSDAVQDVRIKHRWEAIDEYNKALKAHGRGYKAPTLENGDTLKELLARSRYLLYKTPEKWCDSQHTRAKLLFERYPDIKTAYHHAMGLNHVFAAKDKRLKNNHLITTREIAWTRLVKWNDQVEQSNLTPFNTVANTIANHYATILNYFDNKSTNASAESFNAKLKAFRTQFRGVKDVKFFLFRVCKIYA
ncbi:MAG: transposase [Rikenellaceae bacterium]